MSEKFENIVNWPHRAFKRAKDRLLGWKVEGKNPQVIFELGDKTRTLTIPVRQTKKGVKGAAVGVTGFAQFLFWGSKYLLLDNHLTRGLEKGLSQVKVKDEKGKKTNRQKFKNPNLLAHVIYYIIIAATLAGVDLSRDESSIKKTVKSWFADSPDEQENEDEKTINIVSIDTKSSVSDINNTVPHLRAISTKISKTQFVNQAVQEYWNEIVVALTELETYRATPKLQPGEKRSTNGLGLTWYYWYDNNGNLQKRKNLKNNTPTLSKTQIYEQVRLHLIQETLPLLYDAIKGYDNITPQMQIALVMAGYQRPADMKHIARKLAVAKTVQEVADAFSDVSTVPLDYRNGTRVRRYTCALYAIGAISADQFLDWTRDSFSMVNVNTIYRNGHFVISKENIEYLLGRSRKDNNTVRDFLSDFDTGRDVIAGIKKPSKTFLFDEKIKDSSSEKSMALVNKADKKFKKGKYEEAEKLYASALETNPDNMEAYSSLALTYKMLGDKNGSEEYYQKCIDTVVKCNEYMNSNKAMLLDRRVKAMTYYNAGLARQEMGGVAEKAGNVAKAKEQYQLAQKNFKTAKQNAEMIGLDADVIDIYEKAMANAKKMTDALKKLSFKASAAKVKKKSGVKDLTNIKHGEYSV